MERLKTCRGLVSKHAAEASQKCRAAWRTSKQSSPVNMSTSERLYPKLLCCNTLRHCPSSLAAVPCWQAYVSDVRCSTWILRITVQQRKHSNQVMRKERATALRENLNEPKKPQKALLIDLALMSIRLSPSPVAASFHNFPRIQLQWLDTVDSPNKKKGPAIENFR